MTKDQSAQIATLLFQFSAFSESTSLGKPPFYYFKDNLFSVNQEEWSIYTLDFNEKESTHYITTPEHLGNLENFKINIPNNKIRILMNYNKDTLNTPTDPKREPGFVELCSLTKSHEI